MMYVSPEARTVKRTYTVTKAACTAALRTLTATTGFNVRIAASNGARKGFSYGKTRKWPGSTRMQTPAEMFSSEGLNQASP